MSATNQSPTNTFCKIAFLYEEEVKYELEVRGLPNDIKSDDNLNNLSTIMSTEQSPWELPYVYTCRSTK